MASKVNKKFVVILVAGVLASFVAVAGIFFFVRARSGSWNVSRGETAMASGDLEKADTFYARAVAKDPTNIEWLKRWRSIREKLTPETQLKYREAYAMLVNIYQQLATTQRTDLDAHKDILEIRYQQAHDYGSVRDVWASFLDEVEGALRFYTDEPLPLRRYRGLAISTLAQADAKTDEARRTQALKDLADVLKENPKDSAAARAVAQLHLVAAETARLASDPDKQNRELAAAQNAIDALVAADPGNPEAQVASLFIATASADRQADALPNIAERLRTRQEKRNALRPRLDEIKAMLLKADPASLKPAMLGQFLTLAQALDPAQAYPTTQSIADHALSGSPNSALFLLLRAQALEAQGKLPEAQETYAKVAALPNIPLSWEGMRLWELRRRAIFAQANVATTLALRDEAPEAALAKAKEFRQSLAQNVPEDSVMLALIDAKIALAERKIDRVEALLTKVVKAPDEVADQLPQALLLLADVSLRLKKPGTAQRLLVQFDTLRPGSVPIRLRLAQIYAQNQQYEDAASWAQRVLEVEPSNADAKNLLTTVRVLAGREDATAIGDTIVRVLAQAERLDKGTTNVVGDTSAAATYIESQLEANKYEPRLVERAIGYRLKLNQHDQANALIAKAVAADPKNEKFKEYQRVIAAPQTLEGALKVIEQSDVPAWKKSLFSARVYAQFGKNDEANKAISAALAAAPEEPEILLTAFERAINRKDLAEAERLAGVGARINADGAQGDALVARIALAKGNATGASDILQKVVARGTANITVLRTLGVVQIQLGRVAEGIKSIQAALEINPTDILTIRTLIETYVVVDRLDDALLLARKSEPVARSDPDFIELWLSLEAQKGDISVARTRRELMLKQSPSNYRNTASLADLYIQDRKFDDAKKLIDTLKEKSPGLETTNLEARWFADQAQMQAAVKTFLAYVDGLAKKANPDAPKGETTTDAKVQAQENPDLRDAYISFGQFLIAHNEVGLGLKAMEEAARFQDPKTRPVDRMLGDEQLRRGIFDAAERTYRTLVEAGVEDPKNELKKRLIEALVQQERFADAEREIAKISNADSDVELLLLRSNIARGLGDDKRARDLLDKAVAAFPNEPLPYVRRARLLMGDQANSKDAIDDLDNALRLRPGMWQALRTRAGIHAQMRDTNAALKDTIDAMDANPSMDGLRFDTIRALLSAGQESQALTVAEAGLKFRPTNLTYIKALGDLFAQANAWPRAARFYKEIWLQAPEAGAAMYTSALLNMTPPNFNEAEAMLKGTAKIDTNPNLLMVRAAIRKKQNKVDDAQIDMRTSLASVPTQDPRAPEGWYQRFRSIFPEPSTALDTIKDIKGGPALDPYLRLWRGRVMIEDPKTRDAGVALLQALAKDSSETFIKAECYRSLMSVATIQERWSDAEAACRAGLALLPEDVWFMNNLAFILSDHLGKGQDAVELAERAVKAAPQDWNMLDTLATTYWSVGQKDRAIETLTRATRFTNSDVERARCVLKNGKWKLAMGDQSGAAVAGRTLRMLIVDEPIVGKTLGQEIDSFCKEAGVR